MKDESMPLWVLLPPHPPPLCKPAVGCSPVFSNMSIGQTKQYGRVYTEKIFLFYFYEK